MHQRPIPAAQWGNTLPPSGLLMNEGGSDKIPVSTDRRQVPPAAPPPLPPPMARTHCTTPDWLVEKVTQVSKPSRAVPENTQAQVQLTTPGALLKLQAVLVAKLVGDACKRASGEGEGKGGGWWPQTKEQGSGVTDGVHRFEDRAANLCNSLPSHLKAMSRNDGRTKKVKI